MTVCFSDNTFSASSDNRTSHNLWYKKNVSRETFFVVIFQDDVFFT